MARPKEFDVDAALEAAQRVFWDKGFEATTTEDLRLAMGVGRQSFYDTFGSKHDVFLRALRKYSDDRFTETMMLVEHAPGPLPALEKILFAIAEESDTLRRRGCFGVSSMCELGTSDPDAKAIGDQATKRLLEELTILVRDAKRIGGIRREIDEHEAAAQVHATIIGMRVLAKGGAKREMLRSVARGVLRGLTARGA